MTEQAQTTVPQTALPGALSSFWLRLTQAGFILVTLAAWQAATALGGVNSIFLPSPGSVAFQAWAIFPTGAFLADLATTVFSVTLAYGAAAVAGIGIGALLGRNRFAFEVAEPIFSSIFSIPLIIFFPLILLLAGIGPASKIVFAAFYGFFPIALSTMSAFVNVESRYVLYAQTLGASRVRLVRRVLIPAALPQILSGLRIGFVITFASVIAGEMIASLRGLGHEITYFSQIMEPARMFALIGVVILLTAIVNSILTALTRARGS